MNKAHHIYMAYLIQSTRATQARGLINDQGLKVNEKRCKKNLL